jgi:hypothetical protein
LSAKPALVASGSLESALAVGVPPSKSAAAARNGKIAVLVSFNISKSSGQKPARRALHSFADRLKRKDAARYA